jgi:DNA-3-methyladenine glycosylase I
LSPRRVPDDLTEPLRSSSRRRPESRALPRDLKRRGWRFVGLTTVYALAHAMSLVSDHLDGCEAGEALERVRARFGRPGVAGVAENVQRREPPMLERLSCARGGF